MEFYDARGRCSLIYSAVDPTTHRRAPLRWTPRAPIQTCRFRLHNINIITNSTRLPPLARSRINPRSGNGPNTWAGQGANHSILELERDVPVVVLVDVHNVLGQVCFCHSLLLRLGDGRGRSARAGGGSRDHLLRLNVPLRLRAVARQVSRFAATVAFPQVLPVRSLSRVLLSLSVCLRHRHALLLLDAVLVDVAREAAVTTLLGGLVRARARLRRLRLRLEARNLLLEALVLLRRGVSRDQGICGLRQPFTTNPTLITVGRLYAATVLHLHRLELLVDLAEVANHDLVALRQTRSLLDRLDHGLDLLLLIQLPDRWARLEGHPFNEHLVRHQVDRNLPKLRGGSRVVDHHQCTLVLRAQNGQIVLDTHQPVLSPGHDDRRLKVVRIDLPAQRSRRRLGVSLLLFGHSLHHRRDGHVR
mmetsp:Transcript_72146/g.204904  ORF Transcript_72146/g.204904 Transcript_72146/m.204904 type:complete len:418 (-) Transcript_72146:5749-7002(-)